MKDVSLHRVYEAATAWPANLLTAEELSGQVSVSAEQLLEWATQGICPHFRVNDGEPMFKLTAFKKWMLEAHVIAECTGITKADAFTLRVISERPHLGELPLELRSVGKVFDVSSNLLPTGVYFLYLGGKLQYIGQSIEPASRLSQHRHSGKVFDRAYIIPVPAFELDRVEGALIRHFRPPLNGNTAPRIDKALATDTLAQLGFLEQVMEEPEAAEKQMIFDRMPDTSESTGAV